MKNGFSGLNGLLHSSFEAESALYAAAGCAANTAYNNWAAKIASPLNPRGFWSSFGTNHLNQGVSCFNPTAVAAASAVTGGSSSNTSGLNKTSSSMNGSTTGSSLQNLPSVSSSNSLVNSYGNYSSKVSGGINSYPT